MGLVEIAIFFLICVVAVYPLVAAQRDDGEELMARMAPFTGVVGIIAMVLGGIWLVQALPVLGSMLSYFVGILLVVAWIIEIILGVLLAWPLISKYVLKGSYAPKGLTNIQIPLGIVGIAVVAGLLAL